MPNAVIIGGGIIALSTAYYLREQGYEIDILDKKEQLTNCSYGNAGYVCISHFTPLASPGVLQQGLKWMMNSKSPFYVQPRLDWNLIDWTIKFLRNSNKGHVERSAVPLRDISLLSKKLYEEWNALPGFDFAYEEKGLLDFFQTSKSAHHAEALVKKAQGLGIDADLLDKNQAQALEPDVEIDIAGAVFFKGDAHLYPQKLMKNLMERLVAMGVSIHHDQPAIGFVCEGEKIRAVKTATKTYEADEVILAAGAWTHEIARQLNLRMPLVAGRGYSVTYENLPYRFRHPILLTEARVALTPMDGNKLRFGGTMEITSTSTPPKYKRMQGIIESSRRYFPALDIPNPRIDQIWYGYRPCSADGLPYIGRVKSQKNLTIATGHAMLGLSYGPATGKLVTEIITNSALSMDITPFDPARFA